MAVLQIARGQEHQREVREWSGLAGNQGPSLGSHIWGLILVLALTPL